MEKWVTKMNVPMLVCPKAGKHAERLSHFPQAKTHTVTAGFSLLFSRETGLSVVPLYFFNLFFIDV